MRLLGLLGSAAIVVTGGQLAGGHVRWWLDPNLSISGNTAEVIVYAGMAALTLAWLGSTWPGGRGVVPDLHNTGSLWRRSGALWAVPARPWLAAPVFSRDVYSYFAQGTLLHHGLNPYHNVPPVYLARIHQNQALNAVDPFWQHTTAPYGLPLFLEDRRGLIAGARRLARRARGPARQAPRPDRARAAGRVRPPAGAHAGTRSGQSHVAGRAQPTGPVRPCHPRAQRPADGRRDGGRRRLGRGGPAAGRGRGLRPGGHGQAPGGRGGAVHRRGLGPGRQRHVGPPPAAGGECSVRAGAGGVRARQPDHGRGGELGHQHAVLRSGHGQARDHARQRARLHDLRTPVAARQLAAQDAPDRQPSGPCSAGC